MDAFSYLSVLLSIVLGLGITQLLQGFGRLMNARSRVRPYWPSLLWAVVLLVAHVQKLVVDARPVVDPKIQALDGRLRVLLGAPPAQSASAPTSTRAPTPAASKTPAK